MTSFEISIWIYNLSLSLLVTPMNSKFTVFTVETINGNSKPMILKYLPDHSWIAEQVTMKIFTKKYIHRLGKLLEIKKSEKFPLAL